MCTPSLEFGVVSKKEHEILVVASRLAKLYPIVVSKCYCCLCLSVSEKVAEVLCALVFCWGESTKNVMLVGRWTRGSKNVDLVIQCFYIVFKSKTISK